MIRKERGLTQSALAARIGVQQSDLCRMENGEYKVSLDTLFRILGVFGMPIGEFFREETAAPSASDQAREIVAIVERLSPADRQEVLDFARFKGSRRTETWQS